MAKGTLLRGFHTYPSASAMKPVVVLVGRPNVGKSTLFNRLCGTRQALVADVPGLTRDRQYAAGTVGDRPYLVVDTGGLTGWSSAHRRLTTAAKLSDLMREQVQRALGEAEIGRAHV